MIEIFPAIDVIEGRCVRLQQGDYSRKTEYNERPLEVALRFEEAGLRRLHLVDLDGAKAGKVINYKVVEQLALKTKLLIDFGGGISSDDDIRIAFECGVAQVNIGSVAVKKRDMAYRWLERYGAEKIILSADVRKEKIVVSGWSEETDLWLVDYLNQYHEKGITYVSCTDVEQDGTLRGPAFDLYKKIAGECAKLNLIASGGVSAMKDIEMLAEQGLYGVIVGRAIYEGKISIVDLARFNSR